MLQPRRSPGLLSCWQESKPTSVSYSHWPSFWVQMCPESSATPSCSRLSHWTRVGSRLSPLSTQTGQCCLSSLSALLFSLALFPLQGRTLGPGISAPRVTDPQREACFCPRTRAISWGKLRCPLSTMRVLSKLPCDTHSLPFSSSSAVPDLSFLDSYCFHFKWSFFLFLKFSYFSFHPASPSEDHSVSYLSPEHCLLIFQCDHITFSRVFFIGKGASSPKLEGAGISNTSFEVLRMERSWSPTSLSHWVALLIQYQLSMSQAAKNPLRRRVSLRWGLQYIHQAGPGR